MNKKIIIVSLLALTLTACSDTSTAEVAETSAEIGGTTSLREETTATVSETVLSEESEETKTETSVEPVGNVSDTEVVEEEETAHWDTIVYDTTSKVDVTDWELEAENVTNPNTSYTLAETVESLDIPDAVTSCLYENSSTYKLCIDFNYKIRGIASGVKDFDSDGVDETFYAIDYLYYPDGDYGVYSGTTVPERYGAFWSDIVVYDTEDEKIYLCDNNNIYLTCVGCYFASDPAAECKSLDTSRYEECYTWEGANMYFTEDNIFISCNLGVLDSGLVASAHNYYGKLVYENGSYKVESIGTAGWSLNIPPYADVEDVDCYRSASVTGDVPCVIK